MKTIYHFLYIALYSLLNLMLLALGLAAILPAYGIRSYTQILNASLIVISGSAAIIGLFLWYQEKTRRCRAPAAPSPVALALKKCLIFTAAVGLLLAILSVR